MLSRFALAEAGERCVDQGCPRHHELLRPMFVAPDTGFADRERMRRVVLRAFGQSPQATRRNTRAEALA